MYYIKLNDDVISQTDDKMVAVINYRYLLHRADLKDNQYTATLLDDDVMIYQHQINSTTANIDLKSDVNANEIFLSLVQQKQLNVQDIKSIVQSTGLQVSNSKITGWLSQADNRRYQVMQYDELLVMLSQMIDYHDITDWGYSPNNLKKLILITKLSNAQFARTFDIPPNTLSANLSDVENSKHRSMSHKTWLDLSQKVKLFLNNLKNNA